MKIVRHVALSACAAIVASAAFADWDEGFAAFKAGDYDRAATLFRQFVEEQPHGFAGHLMLGRSLLSAGRPADATAPLRQALELKPSDVTARFSLGTALYQTDSFAECVSALNRLHIEDLSTESQRFGLRLRGFCHVGAGNARSAAADLGLLADLDPRNAEARFLHGRWLESAGELRAAIGAYEQALSIDGNHHECRYALARTLVAAGRIAEGVWAGRRFYSKAVEEAKGLVQSRPTSENLILLGEAHLGATAFGKAGAAFRRAISLDRSEWRAHAGLGRAHFLRGKHKSAERAFVVALDLITGDDRKAVWSWLGRVYQRQGRTAEAAAALEYAGQFEAAARVREQGAAARVREREAAEDFEDLVKAIETGRRRPLWLPSEPPPVTTGG